MRFDDYVAMIRKHSHYYAAIFYIEYEEVEAQGFLIYSKAIRDYNPLRASFSTYLYQRLQGQLKDYCMAYFKRVYLDVNDDDSYSQVDNMKARESLSGRAFLDYSKDCLSPLAFKVLKWLVEFNHTETGFNPSVRLVARKLKLKKERVELVWEELMGFWNGPGVAFYLAG